MYAHSKLYSVLSYITWVGWIISFILHDRSDMLVRQHLNQALILNIISSLASIMSRGHGIIGWVGGLIDMVTLFLFIWGVIRAFRMSAEPLPLIGQVKLF